MAGDPRGVVVVAVPRFDEGEHPFRVVFRNIVEVIGDGFADVERGIGGMRLAINR